jgi:hypothetical protein
MLIDRTHRTWLVASCAILAIAAAVYVPYAMHSPSGPNGRSTLGLVYGSIGSAFMVFAALFGARKRVPTWRIGRAQTWMRGHLWLGLLSLPLIFFHAGFRFGGSLTAVLMVLLIAVVASGLFGAALQHYLPKAMMEQVPFETVFEQIDRVRGLLREEADQIVLAACGSPETASPPAKPECAPAVAPAAAGASGITLSEREGAILRRFYEKEMTPFLRESHPCSLALADPQMSRGLFEELRILLPPAVHPTVNDLEEICEEERQLLRQIRLHHWLHGWLLVHVPLSFALLFLGVVHAVMALRY